MLDFSLKDVQAFLEECVLEVATPKEGKGKASQKETMDIATVVQAKLAKRSDISHYLGGNPLGLLELAEIERALEFFQQNVGKWINKVCTPALTGPLNTDVRANLTATSSLVFGACKLLCQEMRKASQSRVVEEREFTINPNEKLRTIEQIIFLAFRTQDPTCYMKSGIKAVFKNQFWKSTSKSKSFIESLESEPKNVPVAPRTPSRASGVPLSQQPIELSKLSSSSGNKASSWGWLVLGVLFAGLGFAFQAVPGMQITGFFLIGMGASFLGGFCSGYGLHTLITITKDWYQRYAPAIKNTFYGILLFVCAAALLAINLFFPNPVTLYLGGVLAYNLLNVGICTLGAICLGVLISSPQNPSATMLALPEDDLTFNPADKSSRSSADSESNLYNQTLTQNNFDQQPTTSSTSGFPRSSSSHSYANSFSSALLAASKPGEADSVPTAPDSFPGAVKVATKRS